MIKNTLVMFALLLVAGVPTVATIWFMNYIIKYTFTLPTPIGVFVYISPILLLVSFFTALVIKITDDKH